MIACVLLAAVRGDPGPARRRADRVAATPELGRHARRSLGCGAGGRARRRGSPRRVLALELEAAGALSIDHERFVSMRRPSSVSAIRSSSVPASPGSRFTLVIRTIGWRSKPLRMQPPERSRPIPAALSREREPRSTPSRRSARPAPRRPRRPSGSCRGPRAGGSAVTFIRSEPSGASRGPRRDEARPGVRGLAAEHPVELTAWPTDSWICRASCSPARTTMCAAGQAGARSRAPPPRGHARRVALEPERQELLVAACSTCPPCEAG